MTSQDITRSISNGKIGAAIVAGAGIAGMQAALDLADAGIKVYLLDNAPAIGGTMAMLDKTFPTNDCAMCIMSPKLVEVGRHLNIELLTCASLESINGEPGNLTVKVRQRPRFVDLSKCTGCGDCAAVCPITVPDEFNTRLSNRKAIYKLYPQAIPNTYAIDKQGIAPCRDACPIQQRAQGYVALIAEGRFADAYRTILADNPFPSICGRVCNHRCEEACNRGQFDEPVNIMALKRFIADWARQNPSLVDFDLIGEIKQPLTGKKVAVVGSGPAGLTCARDLNQLGCSVSVFEALPVPGGMMRVGIPPFRLPTEIVQREIDQIIDQGVQLKLNHRVDDIEALLDDYDAIFVAIGAHKGIKLPIPGNELDGVLIATDFLRQVCLQLDEIPAPGQNQPNNFESKKVLVLGGGNVAIDSAMTAKRLGADWVGMTCLEDRQQMPAHDWEVREAEEEGIQVYPARTFKEITGEGQQVSGVRTAQVNFRGFVDGRPDFDEIPGTEQIIPADLVIFAIGQQPESNCLKRASRGRGGRIVADGETLATDIPGIFAGGDAVTGTTFIVDAIAAGHRASRSIQEYLSGVQIPSAPLQEVAQLSQQDVFQRINTLHVSLSRRNEVPARLATERSSDFKEIFDGFSEQQAYEESGRCLRCGICSECNQCTYACQANAILHNEVEKTFDLNVGAVLLTPGVEPLPGSIRPEFGYGRFPNVVTSLEFERMLSASGPFSGIVQRPSDGTHPRKIAWIQCVGSRDYSGYPQPGRKDAEKTAPYCSSVCCMYATKEAIIAKEHDPLIEPTIFYMDIRSFGKGFEAYIEGAKSKHGIRYVRCMVSSIKEVPLSHNLRLGYVVREPVNGKKPKLQEDEFDLVVLSVGLRPSAETRAMAEKLRINLNQFGFAEVDSYHPTITSHPGVYVAGAFAEPKDIPESVIEASCAAAQISALLSISRGSMTQVPEYPQERDITDEASRVGVFICHCGINIGAVVNVPEVVSFASTLPGVIHAEHNLYTCSQDTQENIVKKIQEHQLNRVVVASCTPRTHQPLFQDTLRQAGINPHLFEMANIREQDSWVHKANPQIATGKAKELVAMSVAKARNLEPISRHTFEVDQRALVIGGGLTGMVAALSIAHQGYSTYLVERQHELGGNLRHIHVGTTTGDEPQRLLRETIAAVLSNTRITVLTDSLVKELGGYAGQYRSRVRNSDGTEIELQHGVILVATGAQEIITNEYLYGKHPDIITQTELEARLSGSESAIPNLNSLVMIQCVGSREDGHPYCSRVCCTQALKNALAIKEHNPGIKLVILYRDLRSYGFREQLYRQAREAGVIFLQYSETEKPQASIRDNDSLTVNVAVQPEGGVISLNPDWLVLSTGIEAEPGNAALAQNLKVPLTEQGFFLEAHVKLAPVDFAAKGIFLAGMAHSPRFIEESITQAQAAAVRAVALLSQPRLQATPIVASVNPKLCAACGICVDTCPYGARLLEPGMDHAEVIEVLCQGCGACIAACPNKASQQKGFEFVQVFSMLDEVYA
ncbi:MAG: FAD-dependent oxidoreductase [Chloroflexota bacterium]|nr:MAG: FAD-dependent oxidoreductase [Chloroflexota bacterium]